MYAPPPLFSVGDVILCTNASTVLSKFDICIDNKQIERYVQNDAMSVNRFG